MYHSVVKSLEHKNDHEHEQHDDDDDDNNARTHARTHHVSKAARQGRHSKASSRSFTMMASVLGGGGLSPVGRIDGYDMTAIMLLILRNRKVYFYPYCTVMMMRRRV